LAHCGHPRRKQGLQRDLDRRVNLVSAARNYEEALTRLRKFKQFEMLRIAARDLVDSAIAMEIVQEISDVADVCSKRSGGFAVNNSTSVSANLIIPTLRTMARRPRVRAWSRQARWSRV
jgi:glutamine synthetase adenylyltransferase